MSTTLLLSSGGAARKEGEMQSHRKARVEDVIIYEELIGKGEPEDPYRRLVVVRQKDGSFIAERDEWKEEHEKHSPKG